MAVKPVEYRLARLRPHSRRTIQDRLALRLPRITNLIKTWVSRLPPESRLRQTLISRAIRENAQALNRGDYEVFLTAYDPEIEINVIGDVTSGGHYRGREGLREFLLNRDEVWEGYRLEPETVIDLGDRYVLLQRHSGRGSGSGIEVDRNLGVVMELGGGMVTRMDFFWSADEALKAAGLRE